MEGPRGGKDAIESGIDLSSITEDQRADYTESFLISFDS